MGWLPMWNFSSEHHKERQMPSTLKLPQMHRADLKPPFNGCLSKRGPAGIPRTPPVH